MNLRRLPVLNLNKLIFGLMMTLSFSATAEETLNTSWKLKDSLLKLPSKDKKPNQHQFKFGLGTKNLANVSVKSSSTTYNFTGQSFPGGQIDYSYAADILGINTKFYSTAGYYTKYNDLGNQGYADLSVFDFFAGINLGYDLFKKFTITPSIFAGLGHSYYFQRGDVEATYADNNVFEGQYGAEISFAIPRNDLYPENWSSKYLVTLRYCEVAQINQKQDEDKNSASKGQNISLLFGVQL